jgi:spore germination protein GerM
MNTIPTDAELFGWLALLAIVLIGMFVVLPIVKRIMDNNEINRIFANRNYTEYHDDMEDWDY